MTALALVVYCPTCGENSERAGASPCPTLAPDTQELLGDECLECVVERMRQEG